jgi:hypothetical protein
MVPADNTTLSPAGGVWVEDSRNQPAPRATETTNETKEG